MASTILSMSAKVAGSTISAPRMLKPSSSAAFWTLRSRVSKRSLPLWGAMLVDSSSTVPEEST